MYLSKEEKLRHLFYKCPFIKNCWRYIRVSVSTLLKSERGIDTLSIKDATSGGRVTLTKSVLSALPSHLLACIKAPKWFYEEVDKRRRAYFWTGHNNTSGAKCKVA
jgi:hypothetical protein